MPESAISRSGKLRFAAYEADPRAGELRKYGYRIPLEDRPFRALLILLQQAPEVVTREELRNALWPADVFIDFDHGLNKAIGKVRRALNDSATNPRFIETVGRRGYRFIAPLTRVDEQEYKSASEPLSATSDAQAITADGKEASAASSPGSTQASNTRPRRVLNSLLAGAVAVTILLAAYVLRPVSAMPHVRGIQQITKSGDVWYLEPLFTDGPRVYYQGRDPNWQFKQVVLNGFENTVVAGVPSGPEDRFFRVRGFSSDDTEFVGLLHGQGSQWTVWTKPIAGGTLRRLGDLIADDVAWSHSGNSLAYARDNQLFLAGSDGSGSHLLATLPGNVIDHIRWSPDDRRLRFTVEASTQQFMLWEIEADGGSLHELRFNWPGRPMECCGDWTPDGRYFVFRSRREATSNLWVMEEKPDWWHRGNRNPVQLTFGPMNYYYPLPSRDGKTIFAIGTLAAGELVRYDPARKEYVPFLGGRSVGQVEFSRDGNWVTYVAFPEDTLWRARSDGSEELQLTLPPLRVRSRPHWSADGKRIVFGGQLSGEGEKAYTISADGGNPEPLPSNTLSQSYPDWNPGEDSIIYAGEVGSSSETALYRFDIKSGQSAQLPGTKGLFCPLWSPDGRRLAALDDSTKRLILVDVKTGKRTQLSRVVAVFPVWSADSQYLYFIQVEGVGRIKVAEGKHDQVIRVPFHLANGILGLTPEGAPLLLREHGHNDVYALSLSRP